jgi:peptidoglycan hydrolase-like protein with peptidoglycan-binding domain
MKSLRTLGLAMLVVAALPVLVTAQLPGEPKAPGPYDPTGDTQYRFKLWSPDERVRSAQRVLQDRGYYRGPIDGLMTPEMRRAVWNFQKDSGFRLSGRLESQTMAALGLAPATAPPRDDTVSGPESQPSASPYERPPARALPGEVQAP